MSQTFKNTILSRIYGNGRGWVFTASDFKDLSNYNLIKKTLSRLEKAGTIRRLTLGLYDYPDQHKKYGLIPPNIEKVAQAIARKNGMKIQPSGAYAANLLGLSTQVPVKITYLTDGPTKSIQIGNREIVFRSTTPKNMKTAGKISGLVIQALRYLKKENVTSQKINTLKAKLQSDDLKKLKQDAKYAPVWVADIINQIL